MQFELLKIEKIEKIDNDELVYDLEVEDDHSYNIEGVIVHNSACATRKITGIGRPQLSTVIDCARDYNYYIDRHHFTIKCEKRKMCICSDGGCAVPGDIVKAFAAGSSFVMLGSMLSGTTECAGDIIEVDGKQYKQFFGMSSNTAMDKFNGGRKRYKASEGRTTLIPVKGDVSHVIEEIMGGLRSACSYVGAEKLEDLEKNSKFIRVKNQLSTVLEKHTIGN